MGFRKCHIAKLLILFVVLSLGSPVAAKEGAGLFPLFFYGNQRVLAEPVSLLNVVPKAYVTWEILTGGQAGETEEDTENAKVRFKLENPGEETVSFSYNVLSGSAEREQHLKGDLQGIVSLSSVAPEMTVTIETKPLANNPDSDFRIPNNHNALWTGERLFYLFCSDIQNALFEGEQQSLTVPVTITSSLDYESSYAAATANKLIDLDSVPNGSGGVFALTSGNPLTLEAIIDGNTRKMLDARVFTHILLPGGILRNQTDTEEMVSYRAFTYRGVEDEYGSEVYPPFPPIFVPADGEISFYSEEFTQSLPVDRLNLGPYAESNGVFKQLAFIFEGDNISTHFLDEDNQYERWQVLFSDQAAPKVLWVFSETQPFYYGDRVPVTITFSEPVYTKDISFQVGGVTLRPLEAPGTISESVSFLYTVGDEALGAGAVTVMITEITGAKDLSGKVQEFSESGSTSLSISGFDAERSLLYCAQPEVLVDLGFSREAVVNISLHLKADPLLRTWLAENSHLDGSVSKVLKARAVTKAGVADLALSVIPDFDDVSQAALLTGSFTAPENTTGMGLDYTLEFYADIDDSSDFRLLSGLTVMYTLPPLVLVDDETDVTINYTGWPATNRILADEAFALSLSYILNIEATWQQSSYFVWSSSDEGVATIDQNGNITVNGTGTVNFSLKISNPISDDTVVLTTPTLTVTPAILTYLFVPDTQSKLEVLKGSGLKVSFSTNITTLNEAELPGFETPYTFTLYSAEYIGEELKRGEIVRQENKSASVAAPIFACNLPGEVLQNTTTKGVFGYILDITARDEAAGIELTATAFIRVREKPAKALLTPPLNLYLTDEAGSFLVRTGAENSTADTEYRLIVTRNSEVTPVAESSAAGLVTIPVSTVAAGRLMDVYTVFFRVKNFDDLVWSTDSFCVYVYRSNTMGFLVEGFPIGGLRIDLQPNLTEGAVYDVGILRSKVQLGLSKTVRLDSSVGWSGNIDQINWSVSGDSVSLWYGQTRIQSGESITLPPKASLQLVGDGGGSATITATHILTGMTQTNQVVVKDTDYLFLFQSTPKENGRLVYTNGNGAEKEIFASHGSAGVYEPSGITSDVVFYPDANVLYDFAVLTKSALDSGQKKTSAFDLYPVHILRLAQANHRVTLSLFDETTGAPYTEDIKVRGGLYVNEIYYSHTKINSHRGDTDQNVTANSHGQYTLSFDVQDYYIQSVRSSSPSDELRYVIEVSFGTSYFPLYVIVENTDIQGKKTDSLGVSISAGIKQIDPSLVQNKIVVLAQSVTLNGKEYSLDDSLLKLDVVPEQALLNMTLLLSDYRDEQNVYYLYLEDGEGQGLGYAGRGVLEHPYPFSNTFTLRFSNNISNALYWMIFNRLLPGEKGYIYPSVEGFIQASGAKTVYRLYKPVRVQSLAGISPLDEDILAEVSLVKLIESLTPGYQVSSISTGNGLVDEALGIAKGVSAYPYQKQIGLEVSSTEDPLVYKGILRYAASKEYFKDNSMSGGIYMREDDPANYTFLPYKRFTGEGKTAFMQRARSGNSTYYFSGGAYAECALNYNLTTKMWELSILKVDLDMGVSRQYERLYNSYIGPVPVTAKFMTELSATAGLTVLHAADGSKTAYIPRLSPGFSIRGSGGVGRDYSVVAFWAGPYGKAGMTQNYLWYRDSDGLTANGQKLSISGEVGVAFEIKLAFLWVEKGEYVLTRYSKSWTYNDYNEISELIKEGLPLSGRMLALDQGELILNDERISIVDRSYLDRFERSWGVATKGRGLTGRDGGATGVLETNANPDSNPRLADDGSMLVYLSDMDSKNLRDTAAVFSLQDANGGYSPSQEINASDYPDEALALSGTASGGASAVWLRYFCDETGIKADAPTTADIVNTLTSVEVMGAIYDPVSQEFTATRLTENTTFEMNPVTAFTGGKAIAAWVNADFVNSDTSLDLASGRLMYSIYTGTGWTEASILHESTPAAVTALSASILEDGRAAILYQAAGAETTSELFITLLSPEGNVLGTLRLGDREGEDFHPQLTAVEFPDGVLRFVAGWNHVEERGGLSIRLAAVNTDGTFYPAFSLQLSDEGSLPNYDGFLFSKGAQTLEQLSLLWVDAEDENGNGVYEYSLYGAKPVKVADGGFSLSGGTKLLTLNEGTELRSLDAETISDSELQLVTVTRQTSGEAVMSSFRVAYQGAISVAEPRFLYADLVPGLDLPFSFTLRNEGMAPITKINLTVGGNSFTYDDLTVLPGEIKSFIALYPVTQPIADEAFLVTATFRSTGQTAAATGTLKLNLPDIGIGQIDATKQGGGERGFRVLLGNNGYAPLVSGKHAVLLEVWDDPNFDDLDDEKTPLWSKLIIGSDITALSDNPLPVNVNLDRVALEPLLSEGEIPLGGAWVFFRVVLLEDGIVIEDAESGNDFDYIKIYSLVEQYGKKISLSSALEIEKDGATLLVNAANNTMGDIKNGNIVATLRDGLGQAVETQISASPLNIPGESIESAVLTFASAGHSVDLAFVTMTTGSARLLALNLTGIPLAFDPDVYEYTLQTSDLSSVTFKAVAEDLAATLTLEQEGIEITLGEPMPLPYGETVFNVKVVASDGLTHSVYIVSIKNSGTESPIISDYFEEENRIARLKIGEINRSDLSVRVEDGQASVSLGNLAREIFGGSTGAALAVPAIPYVNRYLFEMPAEALSGETSGASLVLDTPIAKVSLAFGMLGRMTNLTGKTAGIVIANADITAMSPEVRAAVGNRPVISLMLTLNGEQVDWSNPFTPLTVSIPYIPAAEEGDSLDSIVLWYIDGSGSLHCVTNGRYIPETAMVTFEITHLSLYAVGYNPVTFNDVAASAWYEEAVHYLAARDITTGTTETTFSPDTPVTRGQFITLLLRTYEIDSINQPTDNFADAGNTYYTGYLATAKQLGISKGVGANKFAPEALITRQEMITLLYNALNLLRKLPDDEPGKKLSDFADTESIAAYAKEAMAYLVKADIVKGSDGYLLPKASATRSQVAQLLYNLLRR